MVLTFIRARRFFSQNWTACRQAVEHTVNLEARKVPSQWNFRSPFPICKIENQSNAAIKVGKVRLEQGQSLAIKEPGIFRLALEFSRQPEGSLIVSGQCASGLAPSIFPGNNQFHLGAQENPGKVLLSITLEETAGKKWAFRSQNSQ